MKKIYNKVKSNPDAAAVIKTLENSGTTYKIRSTLFATHFDRGGDNTASIGIFKFRGGRDTNGKRKLPKWIALAHELRHAWQKDQLSLPECVTDAFYDNNVKHIDNQFKNTKASELDASNFENNVRFSAGLPLRLFYDRAEKKPILTKLGKNMYRSTLGAEYTLRNFDNPIFDDNPTLIAIFQIRIYKIK